MNQLAQAEKVVSRWSARGAHQGAFLGIAPTGQEVKVTGIEFDHLVGGSVRVAKGGESRALGEFDVLGMLRQLGVIRPPG